MTKKSQTHAGLKFRKSVSSNMASNNQSSTGTTDAESPTSGYLTTDTSLGHVATNIILTICRKITINIRVEKRLLAYFFLVVFGGILCDFAPILNRAFMPVRTAKTNPLNVYGVKWGWLWTLVLTLPFIVMTSIIMAAFEKKEDEVARVRQDARDGEEQQNQNDNLSEKSIQSSNAAVKQTNFIKKSIKVLSTVVSRDTARMVVNTLVWYFSVNSFVSIEKATKSCSLGGDIPRDPCLKKGGSWTGFDISGHTFLLMFSTLLILEEVSIMEGWEPFGHHLNRLNQYFQKTFRTQSKQYKSFCILSGWIRVNFVLLTILTIIWDFMLMQTALFYHTMIQKAAAAIWATFSWFVLYHGLYRVKFLQGIIRPPTKPVVEDL